MKQGIQYINKFKLITNKCVSCGSSRCEECLRFPTHSRLATLLDQRGWQSTVGLRWKRLLSKFKTVLFQIIVAKYFFFWLWKQFFFHVNRSNRYSLFVSNGIMPEGKSESSVISPSLSTTPVVSLYLCFESSLYTYKYTHTHSQICAVL